VNNLLNRIKKLELDRPVTKERVEVMLTHTNGCRTIKGKEVTEEDVQKLKETPGVLLVNVRFDGRQSHE
jgi:hypothetical protein